MPFSRARHLRTLAYIKGDPRVRARRKGATASGMEEEEHEVYGGEIPDEGEMEGEMDAANADVDMARADEDASKVILLSCFLFPKP